MGQREESRVSRLEPMPTLPSGTSDAVLDALPHPVIMVAADGRIANANAAAESFFEASLRLLRRHMLGELVPFGSPLLALVDQVRVRGAAVNEYKVDLGTPRNPGERLVDLYVAPLPERPDHVVVMLQERTIADKMDRQLTHRGVARHIKFVEDYDPSLPPVLGNRDQLIQVFLNLVKNAAEAIGENAADGEIQLSTAFRPGVRLSLPGSKTRVSLPLEFCVKDNGPGVPEDLMPHLFDPFVTTKASGSGLGLALVAKIVGDHGGIIECESQQRLTVFRVLMPMFTGDGAGPSPA